MEEQHYDDFVRRNRRWNFFANTGDLSAVNLARAFIFTTTILPLYVSYLTSSKVMIGFVPAVLEVGFLLPQLFFARKTETLDRMKPFVVKISIFERVPYLVIALSILLWPDSPPWFAYTMLLLGIAVASGSGGIATPAWKTMLGKIIHHDSRGLLFALGSGIGGFLGIGGALIARRLLVIYPYPISFAWCFGLAFAGQAVSWIFLTLNREPPKAMNPTHSGLFDYARQLPPVLRSDTNFSRYLLGQLFMIFGTMAATFYVLFGKSKFGIDDEFAATLTMIALLGQSAGTPLVGWLSDRLGHKLMGEAGAWMNIAALIVLLVAPSPGWLAATFILMNLGRTALLISRMSITMEFSSIEKLPTYTALTGTLLAIPTFFAPVFGGWGIDIFGYRATFIIAIAFSLVGFVISRRGVTDPRVDGSR